MDFVVTLLQALRLNLFIVALIVFMLGYMQFKSVDIRLFLIAYLITMFLVSFSANVGIIFVSIHFLLGIILIIKLILYKNG